MKKKLFWKQTCRHTIFLIIDAFAFNCNSNVFSCVASVVHLEASASGRGVRAVGQEHGGSE